MLAALVSLVFGRWALLAPEAPRAIPNDNRKPAGTLANGVLTLHLEAREARWYPDGDALPSIVLQPASDSVTIPSSMLVLRRNPPVRITIVNHMQTETGVHWHGLEVPSYPDGVPGWSGIGSRVAPAIAPGDSFVAAFTPTRSGTFIYHAHSNEDFQINLGLYGALLVVDSVYHPERERLIVIGGGGYNDKAARINGKLVPDTMRLTRGETHRVRLIDILPDWTLRLSVLRGDSVIQWRALARDGAELPSRAQVMHRAEMLTGPGQTMDFEYRSDEPGLLRLVVEQREGLWKTQLAIVVSP